MREKILKVFTIENLALFSLLICFVIIAFAATKKTDNYGNIKHILYAYFSECAKSRIQLVILFVLPAFLSFSACAMNTLTETICNNLNIVLSILIAMFFSILGILCALPRPSRTGQGEESRKEARYKELLDSTISAVMFECVLCILLLVLSFFSLFVNMFRKSTWLYIVSGAIYYLTFVVVMNAFVVIKRLEVLVSHRDN